MLKEMYPWDMKVNGTIEGYEVEPCTWNYWENACRPSKVKSYPAFFDGFDFVVVLVVYVTLILLSILIYFLKRKWSEDSLKDSDQPHAESTESYESESNNKRKSLIGAINKSDQSNESELKINQSITKEL